MLAPGRGMVKHQTKLGGSVLGAAQFQLLERSCHRWRQIREHAYSLIFSTPALAMSNTLCSGLELVGRPS